MLSILTNQSLTLYRTPQPQFWNSTIGAIQELTLAHLILWVVLKKRSFNLSRIESGKSSMGGRKRCILKKVRKFLARMLFRLSLPILCLAFSFLLTLLIPLVLQRVNLFGGILRGIKKYVVEFEMSYVNLKVWGLGLRDFEGFDLALLARQCGVLYTLHYLWWLLVSGQNTFLIETSWLPRQAVSHCLFGVVSQKGESTILGSPIKNWKWSLH